MRNDEPSFDTFKNAIKLHSSILKIDAPQKVVGFSDSGLDSLANFLKGVYKTTMQAVSDEHSSGVFGSDGRFGNLPLGFVLQLSHLGSWSVSNLRKRSLKPFGRPSTRTSTFQFKTGLFKRHGSWCWLVLSPVIRNGRELADKSNLPHQIKFFRTVLAGHLPG